MTELRWGPIEGIRNFSVLNFGAPGDDDGDKGSIASARAKTGA